VSISVDRRVWTFMPPWGITQTWGEPAPPGIDWYQKLGYAAQAGDLSAWCSLRSAEPSFPLVGAFAGDKMTFLMAAALGGNINIFSDTLDSGVEVNARMGDGSTALHLVTMFGEHPQMVDALIKAGADVNAVDSAGRMPLYWACRAPGGFGGEMAELLVTAGADVNAALPEGTTVLMEACMHGRYRVAEMLLDHGADPGRKTRAGWTARTFLERTKVKPGGVDEERYERLPARLPVDDFDETKFPLSEDDPVN
jgi:hypothetical protein